MRFHLSTSGIRWLTSAALLLASLSAGAAKATSLFVPVMVGPIMILVSGQPQFSAPPKSVSYSYDALGRLVRVTYSNGTTITYGYDAAGNRVQKSIACGSGGC